MTSTAATLNLEVNLFDLLLDCSAPFAIDVFTDNLGDNLEAGAPP
jgi:hypothetical protein